MPRQRSWTDDDLRRAVAKVSTYKEVQEFLGLQRGSSHVEIRVRIAELGIDDEHLRAEVRRRKTKRARERRNGAPRQRPGRKRGRWDPEELAGAVAASRSYAGVLRALGREPGGGTYVALKREVARLELDTSHFTGQGWAKGLRNPVPVRKRPLEEILVRESDFTSTYWLRKRLIREGIKEARCEVCGITEWNGQPAPLQLDHINGDRRDHRLENLRILCPNCHAQTDTWCSKNIGSYDDIGNVVT